MNIIQTDTKNYLVPSSGNTHAVNFNGLFTSTPYSIDWRQFSIDNFPFSPQGVFIDNSLGTSSLIINFQPINYNVICPLGIVGQFQFPAVDQQTCSITGNGEAVVTFVDFPVLPNSGITQIGNTVNVNVIGPNPIPVSLPAGPQAVQETPLPVTAFYASLSGAGVSVTITPTGGTNLRKVLIKLSDNASNAGGTDLLTLTLNGVIIYKQNIYIPAAAATVLGNVPIDLDFSMLGLNVGVGGLVITLANALTTGILDINAYFG